MIYQTKLVGVSTFQSKDKRQFVKFCVKDTTPAGGSGDFYLTGVASIEQIPSPVVGDLVTVSTDRFGRLVDVQKHIISQKE